MQNVNLKMENDKLKFKMNNNFFILHCHFDF
jgi:hypothetical protein